MFVIYAHWLNYIVNIKNVTAKDKNRFFIKNEMTLMTMIDQRYMGHSIRNSMITPMFGTLHYHL